jgi:hypothetical protein
MTKVCSSNKPSLFELPDLVRKCIDVLKDNGIGRVYPEKVTVLNGKLQVHIAYFRALDTVRAEEFNRGVDLKIGLYIQYRLPVCDQCEIVWTKKTGIWGRTL